MHGTMNIKKKLLNDFCDTSVYVLIEARRSGSALGNM
jgi:hypothetical protein